jgi:hypothetical protein
VRLRLSASVERPARFQAVADRSIVLPAGQELVETTRTLNSVQSDVTVYGVLPHMHELGRSLRVDAHAGAESVCLVSVDRWDFHWQNAWWYQEPLHFDAVDSVSLSCGFDTSERSETVTWGEGTDDEMCLNYLYVSSP